MYNTYRLWKAQNYLKLSDGKTEFIIMGSKTNLKEATTSHITIGHASILPSECIKSVMSHAA